MHPDLSKAYDLLGVKPGVSNRELKAAHRDLAKVWHPDRFLHDPRLQEKAQEKLKEINEAFELLISGKIPKAAPSRSVAETHYPVTRRRASGSQATVTVIIDPESGLLAKQDCPVRSRMTYPTGGQPSAYCNLNHTPPPKASKIKTLAKSVGRVLD